MKELLQTGNRTIDLGEGYKITDLGVGNLYPKGGEVFLRPEELKWFYYNFGYKPEPLFKLKYTEDEFDSNGIGELRYDKGKLNLIDASGNPYDITKKSEAMGFDFYRYISQLGLLKTPFAGGEAGEEFEPEKERFRDKHPKIYKSIGLGAAFLLPIGIIGLGAYHALNNPAKDIAKNINENYEKKIETSIQTPVIAPNNNSEIAPTPEPYLIANQTPVVSPTPKSDLITNQTPVVSPTPYHKFGGHKSGGGSHKLYPTLNKPPIINAGGPYKTFVNESVQLNASDSFDPDGQIKEYSWLVGNNKSKLGAKVNFTFKEPGEHEVLLKITDDKNVSTENKTKVTVFTPYINKNDWDLKLPVPPCSEEKPYFSGAASAKMILDYLGNDSLDQTELYEYGHAHNFNPEILDLDPQGIMAILQVQEYKPEKYNFGIVAKENKTEIMKNICHWLNYEVPGIEKPNSPATIPTFGLYDNWLTIKGASTDINPNATQHPFEVADFVVNGFWVNDPGVNGLGNDSYKTATELADTYLKKIESCPWKNKYIAVCEPKDNNPKISIAPYKPNGDLVNIIQSKIGAMSSTPQFSYENLIPPQLKNDSSFMIAYNNSVAREPIEVDRLDGPDYYLIPFDKEGNTSGVLVVDKNHGYFKEASWVGKPEKYLPINESEAIKLVLEKITPKTIGSNLQWQPGDKSQSPYHPFWKIDADNETYFVVQNGSVYGNDLKPPQSITNLNESKVGQNYIKWVWNNPEDPDFLKTRVYLNDKFLTNLSKTTAEYNATGLNPDTQYILGIKTIDEAGNINQSIVEDYAKTLGLLENKTWEEMNFTERKGLVEEFLAVDPTPYAKINQCLYIADRLYQNATNAKELYGLEDNIPMQFQHEPPGHICNAVLLGNNKSNIEHFGRIDGEDHIGVFDKNITLPFESNTTRYIWKTGRWRIPDEKYRLTNYSVGFDVHWEPNQKSNITIIPTWPHPINYTEVKPA